MVSSLFCSCFCCIYTNKTFVKDILVKMTDCIELYLIANSILDKTASCSQCRGIGKGFPWVFKISGRPNKSLHK